MIDDLKPYPAYKDSGVPWIGPIPEHWGIRRMKLLLREVDARSTDGGRQLLRVSQYTGVTERKAIDGVELPNTRAKSLVGYKLVSKNDLVINIMLAWNGSLGVSNYGGIVSPAYCVYRFNSGSLPWYYHQLLRTSTYKEQIRNASAGIVESRLRLYSDALGRIEALEPSGEEQNSIVHYVHHLDGKINRFIYAKKKLIGLLNEQKQAIIERAVTRGLGAQLKLRPSGVRWIGNIPSPWTVSRLKFVCSRIVDCLHATPVYDENGEYPAIRTADVEAGRLRLNQARRVNREHYEAWTVRMRPRAGDILYTREGERYGLAAIVPDGVELCISQRMMAFRVRPEHCPEYIMWQLNIQNSYEQASQDVMGATSPHVNISTIKNLFLVLPPKHEQLQIAEFIRETTIPINQAVDCIREEIKQVVELRARLLSDVVTGKLDVRAAAAKLPDIKSEAEQLDEIGNVMEVESVTDEFEVAEAA